MAIKVVASDFVALNANSDEVVDEITALANGTHVITSHLHSGAGQNIVYYSRLYSSSYQLLGEPVKIGTYAVSNAPQISTAVDAGDGTYWLTWYAPPLAGQTSRNVLGQHFAADGSKIGVETALPALSGGRSLLDNGLVFTGVAAEPIAYANVKTVAGQSGKSVTLSTFKSDFTAHDAAFVVASGQAGDATIVDVAAGTNGKVIVAWLGESAAGSAKKTLSVGIADTAANSALAPIKISTGGIKDAQIDVFDTGGFVVTWRETYDKSPNGIRIVAHVYGADGKLVSKATTITQQEKVFGNDFETVALPDGRFAVMWVTEDRDNAKKTPLFLQLYSNDGKFITDEIVVSYVPRVASGVNLNAVLDDSGNIVISGTGLVDGKPAFRSVVFDPTVFVATKMNDTWNGGVGDETFDGGLGDDKLVGNGGNDTLFGGFGSDRLQGGEGADNLNGGKGRDYASYFTDKPVHVSLDGSIEARGAAVGDRFISIEGLFGSDKGSDILGGNHLDNILIGYNGNDNLQGNDGDDYLAGGDGADRLIGGEGEDTADYCDDKGVVASLSNRRLNTGAAAGDRYYSIENLSGSETGADTLTGNSHENELYGSGGNDKLYGAGGEDFISGGTGNDELYGGSGDDEFDPGSGKDSVSGGSGYDRVFYGDGGAITVSLSNTFASSGDAKGDTYNGIEGVFGSGKADKISGSNSGNSLLGKAGNDHLIGLGGDDYLQGGAGKDVLDGGAGLDMADYYNDRGLTIALDGSVKNTGAAAGDKFISIENIGGTSRYSDKLIGNDGKNYIVGGGGNDKLYGRDGEDGLNGGLGKDTLNGGGGTNDYYVYYNANEGGDKVTNFETGEYFSFSQSLIKNAYSGELLPDYLFQSGKSNVAKNGDVRLIFDTRDDTLWLDVDGRGGEKAVMMADIQNEHNLLASEIYVF